MGCQIPHGVGRLFPQKGDAMQGATAKPRQAERSSTQWWQWGRRLVGMSEDKRDEDFHAGGAKRHRDLKPESGEEGKGMEDVMAAVEYWLHIRRLIK